MGEMVTETDSKLPATKTRYRPLKNGLWAKNLSKGVDKRTQIGRMIQKLQNELIRHVGSHPSVTEAILIDRICSKVVRCRLYEAGLFCERANGIERSFLSVPGISGWEGTENGLRLDNIALTRFEAEGGPEKIWDLN